MGRQKKIGETKILIEENVEKNSFKVTSEKKKWRNEPINKTIQTKRIKMERIYVVTVYLYDFYFNDKIAIVDLKGFYFINDRKIDVLFLFSIYFLKKQICMLHFVQYFRFSSAKHIYLNKIKSKKKKQMSWAANFLSQLWVERYVSQSKDSQHGNVYI